MTSNGDLSPVVSSGGPPQAMGGGYEPANLADILERVLDRGLVVVGDIRVNLLDIELLTIKLRLVIASLQTAKQVGMNWWERDPWFTGTDPELQQENEDLRARIAELEQQTKKRTAVDGGPHRPAKRQAPAKRVRRPKGPDRDE